ncbi:DUF6431 domain-containing protein [Natribacillus halophilus]|uniref:DUF6431 domain-containing protein n=1 Tax=Natribacillus halophilus TaxID=549003 RepID=A0A1G8PCF4_9BACI|nr:DUF6431 domain-containing protein [Natribacillus halophilus]SDI89420.1 hypothetical protein SAMN04488123_10833 [Natribacillus halophilus]
MILFHDFGADLKTYAEKGPANDFPTFHSCPACSSINTLHRHGFYWRYGITEEGAEYIPICRLRCPSCKKTFSILPDFLIPYYQHTLHTVVDRIATVLQKEKGSGFRQLVAFYKRRFLKHLKWLHSFFTDHGVSVSFPCENKNATKYLTMIRDFGESTFLRRSKGHLSSYFMAPPV